MHDFIKNNQNLSLSNYYIKLTNSKLLNPVNFIFFKNNFNKSELKIFDNSKVFNLYKNPRNTSYVNSSDFNINKNSSSSCDKSSNKMVDLNTMSLSNNNNNKNILFKKKNIYLINKRKSESQDRTYFLPNLNIKDNNFKKKPKFQGKKVPSFHSDKIELINYNTKDNIKIKNEQNFLDECIKESYRSLRNIKDLNKSKCFVDYSKSSIMGDKLAMKKKEEAPIKEKLIFPGFEYKSIYRYTFNGKLPRSKSNIIL
jgi:NifU-like protein involved in Fe-S cluster formation